MQIDYLVIGAGAMGMAFTDVIVTETDKTVAIVDRRGRPGGHWNDSYPHVRLHQPSAFYGVNSRELGSGQIDTHGWNKGLYELASGTEVVTYFEQVMQQQFLPSGRVQYFPMSEYMGKGTFRSVVSGVEQTIEATKVVDATYMNVTVPSVAGPSYDVAPGMRCIPPNDLAKIGVLPADEYTVIGGGKTAMDAVLWLLQHEVDPTRIRWIRPRDSWCLNRVNIQPGDEFAEHTIGGFAAQNDIVAEAESIEQMFLELERNDLLLRIDPTVTPTMYRCATVTSVEIEAMRRVENVVRLGRVRAIRADQIELESGSVPTHDGVIHIDCTADGLERRPVEPIFDGDRLTLQTVRTCQQVFSAAFIAHVESAYDDDATKNDLATVIPHPNTDIDWLRVTLANAMNSGKWRADAELSAWLQDARLDAFSSLRGIGDAETDPERIALRDRLVARAVDAAMNLHTLLADH